MPGTKARPRSGSTPGKAARSSQRTPPAGPRAAPSAVSAAAALAAAAAEEESRLRQRNRLTLEDDKPAAERCLEQLVFGDVEDDEDALLQRLRSSRVRKACLLSGHTLRRGARREARPPGGGAWGTCGGECSGGRDRRPRAPRGAVALSASGSGMRAGEGGDAVFLRPKGAAALSIQQALNCWLGSPKVVCKGESHSFGLLHPLPEPQGWPFDHLSRLPCSGWNQYMGRRLKAAF